MKKVIFTILSVAFMFSAANAQYCGPSGTSVCSPSGTLAEPGLVPKPDSLPAVVVGQYTQSIIQFKNFDQVTVSGNTAAIQSLTIDTISNLPPGLCWATNKSDNTYGNQEEGCIRVTGTPTGPVGQYKLNIIVTVDIGLPFNIQTSAEDAGLKYFVRCINNGAVIPCVDTLAGSYVAYTGAEVACAVQPPLGIKENTNPIQALSILPNPMNNSAVVSFMSDRTTTMTERITNMIGAELTNRTIEVKSGENNIVIERNNMPTGVYFYTMTNGKATKTIRFVVE